MLLFYFQIWNSGGMGVRGTKLKLFFGLIYIKEEFTNLKKIHIYYILIGIKSWLVVLSSLYTWIPSSTIESRGLIKNFILRFHLSALKVTKSEHQSCCVGYTTGVFSGFSVLFRKVSTILLT
jgi:hypothetical protein